MSKPFRLSRRHVLRGLGATIALPMLEVMSPYSRFKSSVAGAQATSLPKRMIIFTSPNGIYMNEFTPLTAGEGWAMPRILNSFANRSGEINVITGLSNYRLAQPWYPTADINHHPLAVPMLLTGAAPQVGPLATPDPLQGGTQWVTSAGGPSVDQVAAREVGVATRFTNITIYSDYGTARSPANHRYTWNGVNSPGGFLMKPRDIFDTLFTDVVGDPATAQRHQKINQSILDAVSGSISDLQQKVSVADRQRLDEHFTSIQELERRISTSIVACTQPADPGAANAYDNDAVYRERLELQMQLAAMALKCDLTRIMVFNLGATMYGVPDGFLNLGNEDHGVSHYFATTVSGPEGYTIISQYKVSTFARFLQILGGIPEGSGSLVDQSALAFVSEFSDGGTHCPDFLPVLTAGGLGGMRRGQHLVMPCNPLRQAVRSGDRLQAFGNGGYTPLSNLWLTMLRAIGSNATSFGDSTGTVSGLWV